MDISFKGSGAKILWALAKRILSNSSAGRPQRITVQTKTNSAEASIKPHQVTYWEQPSTQADFNRPLSLKLKTQLEVQKTWWQWPVLSQIKISLTVKYWKVYKIPFLKRKMGKQIYKILKHPRYQDQSCRIFLYSKINRKLPTTKRSAVIRWTSNLQSIPIWNSPKSPSSSSRRAASRMKTTITEQVRLSRMKLTKRMVICLAVSFSCWNHQIKARSSWHTSWNMWIQTRDSSPRRSQWMTMQPMVNWVK